MLNKFGGHYVGERVGNKTLIEYIGQNNHGHHIWNWLSGCCNQVYGPSTFSHLNRYTKSKCLNCSLAKENNPNWCGYKELTGTWLCDTKHGAISRNLEWNITPQYLWKIWLKQKGLCIYTGRTLTHGIDASLDRRDNACGYIKGNVQWVHRDINRMKTDFTEDNFLQLCLDVAKQNK